MSEREKPTPETKPEENRYVCIHGHFYQPPRENPWLEEIELQDSARPYRDWNERITAECYSPNSAARILGPGGRIIKIINNYSRISFNFGPTLLSWMESHAGDVYDAIIEADRESRERFSGHGAAIAQVYNHVIMPLANRRDRRTQIEWGIRDFIHRFGRDPEGMWLAETAVDTDTLEMLAESGIRYTILAPHQAKRMRAASSEKWYDVSGATIDPRKSYEMQLPSGRKIALFFYDGPISQELAFGGLLANGERFAHRLLAAFTPDTVVPELVHIATDGETYGHHHRHGDMALAYCLHHIETNALAKISVYGEYLDIAPPEHEVEIIDNTSWSCAHGIERWRSNCGCNSGRIGWTQEWRAPLRTTLNWLRDELDPFYEEEMGSFKKDPWKLRNDYIGLILERTPENVKRFFNTNGSAGIGQSEKTRMLKLLEMQRHLMLMYTSCGWFFDEISGIETVQVLLYAARAIQLARELGFSDLESRFIDRLAGIRSNIPHLKTGRRVYELYVRPSVVDFLRVAAHYAVSSLFTDYSETPRIFSWEVFTKDYERLEAGKQKVAYGRARMRSLITFEEQTFTFAFLHMGDHNLNGGVKHTVPGEPYEEMTEELREAFSKLNIADIILLIDKHFGTHSYTLWHLFKEESRRIYRIIMESSLRDIEYMYRQIYENHYPIMLSMVDTHTPLPDALRGPVEFVLNNDFKDTLVDEERIDLARLEHLSEEVIRFSVRLDTQMLGFHASQRITRQMEDILNKPEDLDLLREICDTLETLIDLSIQPNLWKAQNMLFSLSETAYDPIRQRADAGDPEATEWIERFDDLEQLMNTRIP